MFYKLTQTNVGTDSLLRQRFTMSCSFISALVDDLTRPGELAIAEKARVAQNRLREEREAREKLERETREAKDREKQRLVKAAVEKKQRCVPCSLVGPPSCMCTRSNVARIPRIPLRANITENG